MSVATGREKYAAKAESMARNWGRGIGRAKARGAYRAGLVSAGVANPDPLRIQNWDTNTTGKEAAYGEAIRGKAEKWQTNYLAAMGA